jgi:hypothetical protein
MKKKAIFGLVVLVSAILLSSTGMVLAGGNGKDTDPGVWINYANIKVEWLWADSNPWSGTDLGTGYYYKWAEDRDLDGIYGEGWVQADYGKYGGIVNKFESSDVNFYFDSEPMVFTDKVIHLTETWVPGVTVPGGENHFVVKDMDGDGEYIGGFNTVLFWDGLTKNSDGPYLFQQKFEYQYFTGTAGMVTDGYYIEYQYFNIPGTPGAPSGGQ